MSLDRWMVQVRGNRDTAPHLKIRHHRLDRPLVQLWGELGHRPRRKQTSEAPSSVRSGLSPRAGLVPPAIQSRPSPSQIWPRAMRASECALVCLQGILDYARARCGHGVFFYFYYFYFLFGLRRASAFRLRPPRRIYAWRICLGPLATTSFCIARH